MPTGTPFLKFKILLKLVLKIQNPLTVASTNIISECRQTVMTDVMNLYPFYTSFPLSSMLCVIQVRNYMSQNKIWKLLQCGNDIKGTFDVLSVKFVSFS